LSNHGFAHAAVTLDVILVCDPKGSLEGRMKRLLATTCRRSQPRSVQQFPDARLDIGRPA
jgi:hypothetical protein